MNKVAIFILFTLASVVGYAQPHLGHTKHPAVFEDSLHTKLLDLKKGEALYVETHNIVDGRYKLVHLRTKKVGFIKTDDIKLDRKLEIESTFEPLISTEKDPTLRVHNNSKTPMKFKFAKKDYVLEPGTITTIRIAKGTYNYHVSSSAMEDNSGKEVLEDYHLYEWEFYVEDTEEK